MVGSPPARILIPSAGQQGDVNVRRQEAANEWTLTAIELGTTGGAIVLGTLIVFLFGARPSAYPRGFGPHDRRPGPSGDVPAR
jgi:hypothetical protein